MTESNTKTDWNRSELYTLAQLADIEGRSEMTKSELLESLESEAAHLLDPFQLAWELEEDDKVEMNHLKSTLTVTGIQDEEEFLGITMRTPRGGRHKLVIPKDDNEVGKNGNRPHLERWRAGDQEWMNNSDDPIYIKAAE